MTFDSVMFIVIAGLAAGTAVAASGAALIAVIFACAAALMMGASFQPVAIFIGAAFIGAMLSLMNADGWRIKR